MRLRVEASLIKAAPSLWTGSVLTSTVQGHGRTAHGGRTWGDVVAPTRRTRKEPHLFSWFGLHQNPLLPQVRVKQTTHLHRSTPPICPTQQTWSLFLLTPSPEPTTVSPALDTLVVLVTSTPYCRQCSAPYTRHVRPQLLAPLQQCHHQATVAAIQPQAASLLPKGR